MIKILLVDDDSFFQTTFLSLADWEAFGCTIAYQAENGQQAVSILSHHPVAVMITDMVMPAMSGVELIRYVRREYPQVRCFALSSFDDFDYVRQSLREGAQDYLLKHALNRGVIEELLSSLAPEGPAPRRADDHAIFANLFVSMIREPDGDASQMQRIITESGVDFPRPPLLAVSIRLQDVTALLRRFQTKDRYLQFLATATNIAQGALEHYGRALCVPDDYDTIYAVVSNERFSSRLYGSQVSHLLKKNLTSVLNRYCNLSVSIAVNSGCDAIEDVLPAFRTLESELGMQAGLDYLQEQDADTPVISIRLESERALLEWMHDGSFEDVQRVIREEFETCRAQSPSRNAIRHICMEFLNLLNRICRNESISMDKLFSSDASPYAVASRISSFTETVEFITEAYLALYTLMHDGEASGNLIVKNALRVIRSRYTQDISLSSVAESIHCNPAYLSRVFKSETGKGFVQYLNDYRLAQARRLMDSETIPLRLIAQRVGFPNYNYFSRIFKQRLGVTPQAYMKKRPSDTDADE